MKKQRKEYTAEWYKKMREKNPEWYEARKKDTAEREKKKYWDIKNSLVKERAIELSRMTDIPAIEEYIKKHFMVRRK